MLLHFLIPYSFSFSRSRLSRHFTFAFVQSVVVWVLNLQSISGERGERTAAPGIARKRRAASEDKKKRIPATPLAWSDSAVFFELRKGIQGNSRKSHDSIRIL